MTTRRAELLGLFRALLNKRMAGVIDESDLPLDEPTLEMLRAALRTYGTFIYPVTLRSDGTVIDGRHRLFVAAEMSIPAATRTIEVTDQEAIELRLALNLARRTVQPGERDAGIRLLRRHQFTQREIAARLGISQATVNRVLAHDSAESRNKPGPAKGAGKASAEQRSRLQDEAIRLRQRGYSLKQIAAAAKVSQSTVSNLTRYHGPARVTAKSKPTEDLPAISWRAPHRERIDARSNYQLMGEAMMAIRQWIRTCENDNALSKFASSVTEAAEAADTGWMQEQRVQVVHAQELLTVMLNALDDERARRRTVDSRAAEDVARVRIHVVKPASDAG